ncbi:hypothetical protein [Helicobacter cappadocius]|uniref:Uncharacterized protein n=1 Tax=Helicobacter cappadocius TaxID=3063998 RepID=A0AA90PQF0_9HELI|nr:MULTISPECIES: hypothetical protein [unclassified Helicobacter]MDO7252783.1 hypothetical protein [Helicobacter sp. faydin-H75]MDP2538826.1 hypothetical protein [Helicobacter sp. faydin-H76]
MNLSYERQMAIAISQSIIQKYGVVLSVKNLAEILGIGMQSLQNKLCNQDKDMPKYTQLKGKKVFMANDIAEWMISNDLKFPK